MRLFVAIDLDSAIRKRVAQFAQGVQGFAPEARWTRPESWHLTLKFIGETGAENLGSIKAQLGKIHAAPASFVLRGTGFFPTPSSARVFWAGVQADSNLAALAEAVDRTLGAIGIPFEERAFSPHLTLARSGSASPGRQKGDRSSKQFARLQRQLGKMPETDFGTMTAREFFLYQSKTSPKGAEYTKLARFELR